MRKLHWVVALGALAVASSALAGQVRGKVAGADKLIPSIYAELAKLESHHYTWREPSPTVKPDFRSALGEPVA